MPKKSTKTTTGKISKLKSVRISEKQRTLVLLLLLALSIGLLYYVRISIDTNFVDQL